MLHAFTCKKTQTFVLNKNGLKVSKLCSSTINYSLQIIGFRGFFILGLLNEIDLIII